MADEMKAMSPEDIEAEAQATAYMQTQSYWNTWQHWLIMRLSPRAYIRSAFISGYKWRVR